MAFRHVENRIGLQPIADVSTTQQHPLGTIVRAVDPTYGEGEFIYVKGATNGAVGSWAYYNSDDYATSLASADGTGALCVFMSVLDASTDYGWAQIQGKAQGLCLSGFLDNGVVYLTNTAGSVDDSDVAGDYVFNAKGASNRDATTGLADFEISRPHTSDNLED